MQQIRAQSNSFNSRAREGRDFPHTRCTRNQSCFNSRAREGRDVIGGGRNLLEEGFNSRAREGRDVADEIDRILGRFQFTRPRGARRRRSRPAPTRWGFNSRAREGRDRQSSFIAKLLSVSIHAPARGATRLGWEITGEGMEFQFTRPRGARRVSRARVRTLSRFQFTRPRGARPAAASRCAAGSVSIHAPARGATRSGGRCFT